jgi:4-diphosphocytidyl-2-C-methyl-D-erythritol kinase
VKSVESAGVPSPTPASPPGGLRALRFAPAKLNLTLAVVGRREDGFHALHSVMVPLGFGDDIEVVVRPDGRRDSLAVEGLEVAQSPENLVLRAMSATRAAVKASGSAPAGTLPALAARLTKRIPVAAGLGGGSSDAAATVAAALEAWGAALSTDAAAELAATLGSDVPFFLAGSAALVTGRGEFVEPLPDLRGRAPAVLIVTPALRVSTAAVFAAYAGGARLPTRASLAVSERVAADLRAGLSGAALIGRADELAAANDLLPATLSVAPSLAVFRASLGRILDRPIGQSGSGPTAWVLYPSLSAARRAARLVRQAALDGRLPAAADDRPFVATSTILAPWPHANAPDAHNGGRSIQKGR